MGNSGINRILSRIVLLWIILLFLPNIALAVDYCDFTSQKEECEKIMGFPLPDFLKKMLLDYIFYDKEIPDHDLVYEWNNNLNFNYEKKNRGVIKSAYVKLVSVYPSVLIEDKVYIPDKGEILIKYGHKVKLPTKRHRGDCKTKYELEKDSERLRLYINGKYQGEDTDFSNLNFNHDQQIEIEITYRIEVRYRIKHYERDSDGDCEYDSSERKKKRLTLRTSKYVYFYKEKPSYNFEILDKYFNTLNGRLDANNFSSLELNFPNSFFKQFNYFYSLNFDNENILTVKAEKKDNFNFKNLIVERDFDETFFQSLFHVQDHNQCELILRDHFFETKQDCNLNFTKPETEPIEIHEINMDKIYPVLEIAFFLFIIYFTFKVAKKFGGKNGRL